MAPEAIMNLQFSTKSDVWAFGVTAYEIFIRDDAEFEFVPPETVAGVGDGVGDGVGTNVTVRVGGVG